MLCCIDTWNISSPGCFFSVEMTQVDILATVTTVASCARKWYRNGTLLLIWLGIAGKILFGVFLLCQC